ncbi:MAG: ribonuclease PH, partial [Anoxybacillus ayderensis]|nr:ribonuclease PH [Anoxybacillus ayderensis]
TGEEATFSYEQLLDLLTVAEKGIHELIARQKEALGSLAEQIMQHRSEGEEAK